MITHLPNISAGLTDAGQENKTGHPFSRTQSCLTSEIVKMVYKSLKHVDETEIRTLRINTNGILCNILSGQILHWRDFDF